MYSRKMALVLLAFLTVVLIGLRLPIIGYGMPFDLGNVDENDFIGEALHYGAFKTIKPIITWYPAFYSYLLSAGIAVYFLLLLAAGQLAGVTEFAGSYLLEPGFFHLVGRVQALFFSILTLLLLYQCGKQYKDTLTGLLTATLFTLSTVVLQRTVWALPESAFLLLSVTSLYFVLKFHQSRKVQDILWSGLFCGLGISTKINVGSLALIGIAGCFLVKRDQRKSLTDGFIIECLKSRSLYLYSGFLVVGFLLGSPYWLVDLRENLSGLEWELGRLAVEKGGSPDLVFSKWPVVWIFSELILNETGMGALILWAVVYQCYRMFKGDIALYLFFPYLVASLLLIGVQGKHSIHYFIPVFPVLFLLTGATLAPFFSSPVRWRRSVAVAAIVALLITGYSSAGYAYSYSGKDTRLQAREWIQSHAPPGSTIAMGKNTSSPPLPDNTRFDKLYYSSISEQIMAKSLPESIKAVYYQRTGESSYRIVTYIVKGSFGRQASFSSMMEDFTIVPYEDIASANPLFLVFSMPDTLYLAPRNFRDILDVPGYRDHLRFVTQFLPGPRTASAPSLFLYRFTE